MTWPDYGFVLQGGNEQKDTSDNNTCTNGFGNFNLNIQVLVRP